MNRYINLYILCLPAIFLLLTVMPLFSQEEPPPLVTDRPDQTESPLTVPGNSFQIEMGFLFTNAKETENSIETESESFEFGKTLLRYGLLEYLELRLTGGFITQKVKNDMGEIVAEGISGISAGVKIHIIEEDNLIPETGLITDIVFPLGQTDLTSKNWHPGFIFAMGYTLSEIFSLSFNLGGRSGEDNPFIIKYSAALGVGLSDRSGLFLEIFGKKPSLSQNQLNFDTGLTYLIMPNFQMDLSTGLSITDRPFEWFINVGFSWRLPK